jgi:fluoride exporter
VPVQIILIALGGAIGSVCRYGLSTVVQRSTSPFFPYGTFTVNVTGCLVFGIIMGAARERFVLGPTERAFLLIGVLGGYTTFSTFTYETFALLQDGELVRAVVNAFGQLVCGLVALWAGYAFVLAL